MEVEHYKWQVVAKSKDKKSTCSIKCRTLKEARDVMARVQREGIWEPSKSHDHPNQQQERRKMSKHVWKQNMDTKAREIVTEFGISCSLSCNGQGCSSDCQYTHAVEVLSLALHDAAKVKDGCVRFPEEPDTPISGKPPKTADGAYVVCGAGHVFMVHNGEVQESFNWDGWGAKFWEDFSKGLDSFCMDPSMCYSTPEAAQRAKEAK